MGLHFDLRAANWVAYLIDPKRPLPRLSEDYQEAETLRIFLRNFRENFFSSLEYRRHFRFEAEEAMVALEDMDRHWQRPESSGRISSALAVLRRLLSDRPWTALVVPGSADREIDQMLCSKKFLQELVHVRPEDPGLILQLDSPPDDSFSLPDIFPAFRTALADSNQWPGVLLWTNSGDSEFFPLPARQDSIRERTRWLFSHLATAYGVDLELLKQQYVHEFPEAVRSSREVVIIQMSDLHVGSREASLRIPRLQQLVRNLISEIGEKKKFVFAVSGDLMDHPDERNLDSVRSFIDFLSNLGGDALITCLGNHDVRNDGYLSENLRMVMRVPQANLALTWLEDEHVGLAVFNSVIGGHLARGEIGEQQLLDMGSQIDRRKDAKDFRLLGMLHHHPVPVSRPEWYSRPFYERLFGRNIEKTDELADAARFNAFIESRRFRCVFHGHKHIPHISHTDKRVPVFGCGSSVGKVATKDGNPYMSVNVISLDTQSGKLTARLLAERIPGGGLQEEKRHEMISRSTE
jgi:hypothetical protein